MKKITLYKYDELSSEAQDYAYKAWLKKKPEAEVEILDCCDECLRELYDLGIIVELRGDTQASITFSTAIHNRAYSRGLPSLISAMKFYDEISLEPKTYVLFSDEDIVYEKCYRKSNFQLKRTKGVNYLGRLFRTYLKNLINSKDLSLSFYDYLRLSVWALLEEVKKEVNKARSLEKFEASTRNLVALYNEKGVYWDAEDHFDFLFKGLYK